MVTNFVCAPPSLTPGKATGDVAISFIDSGGVSSSLVAKPTLRSPATAMSSMASIGCLPSRAAISPMVQPS